MGDTRFDPPYDRLRRSSDKVHLIAAMHDAEVIVALGGAARSGDAYLANVLATEALNRHRRLTALFAAVAYGAAAFIVPRVVLQFILADPRADASETLRMALTFVLLLVGGTTAAVAYWRARRASAYVDV